MFELIACVGLHWIVKYGTILNTIRTPLKKIRFLNELLKCSLCLGFWCGVVIGIFYNNWLLPLASAATCWFVDNINNVLQSLEIKLDNRE